MALSVVVTKKSVILTQSKLWLITLNMTLLNDGVEAFSKDYSIKYRTGDLISAKVVRFIELMQKDIDIYKSEQLIFNNAQLNTAVINVQAGLGV